MRWQVRLERSARRKPSWKATIEHADPIVPEITQQPPDVRGVKPLTAAGIVIGDQQMFIANAKLGGHTGEMILWYNVKTKLPVRIYHEVDSAFPRITKDMTNFQWNVPIDGKLFTPEIPKDYVEDKRDFNLK